VRQLHDQRTDRVAAMRGLPDEPVLLHGQQQPVHGAGGQAGGPGQVADPEVRRPRVEAPEDRDSAVDRLHRTAHFLHCETISRDTGSVSM
jgi:hypothetical protein